MSTDGHPDSSIPPFNFVERGYNYVPNEHEDVDQYGSFAIPTEIIPTEIKLTCSSATNYVPNEHEDVDQYGSFAKPSEIMPC